MSIGLGDCVDIEVTILPVEQKYLLALLLTMQMGRVFQSLTICDGNESSKRGVARVVSFSLGQTGVLDLGAAFKVSGAAVV